MRRRRRLCLLCIPPGSRVLDARVLVLVAVDAQQLPIAAVRRIVVVIAILVMHGQLAQTLARELAAAARADVRQQLEGLIAIVHEKNYPLFLRPAATPLMVRWMAR